MTDINEDLFQVRCRICDMIVSSSAILSVPALAASLFRITTVGWQWIMAVHIAATLFIWFLFLSKRSLPNTFRAAAIVLIFLIVGFAGFWKYGMFAGAGPLLIVAPVLATVLFGMRTGAIISAAIVLMMALTAFSFMYGGRILTIEHTASPTFIPAWITYLLAVVLSITVAIAAIAMSNHHLATALSTSRRTQGELSDLNSTLENEVLKRTEELEQAKLDAERQARTDELTGQNNRRAFFEYAHVIDGQARRYNRPYAIAMIDIDHFKAVNDTWGHDSGDAALVAVGDLIANSLRGTDIIGRIGGEEFAIILPETGAQEAVVLVERLRSIIEDTIIQTAKTEIKLTASIGVAAFDDSTEPLEQIVAYADAALYEAKAAGRNRVVLHCADPQHHLEPDINS